MTVIIWRISNSNINLKGYLFMFTPNIIKNIVGSNEKNILYCILKTVNKSA